MKYLKIALLIILFVALTGCYSSKDSSTDTPYFENSGSVDYSYLFGLDEPGREFVFDGKEIEIPIEITNNYQSFDLGFLVYINGIAHSYKIKDGDFKLNRDFEIEYITVPEKTICNLILIVIPEVGLKGETLQLEVGSMLNPAYTPDDGNEDFGHNHKAMILQPSNLILKKDTINTKSYNDIEIKQENITTDIINKYQLPDAMPVNNYNFGILSNIDTGIPWGGAVHLDESKNIEIIAHGNLKQEFAVNVYVNHKAVSTFKLDVMEGYLSRIIVNIGEHLTSEKDFTYVTMIPINNMTVFSEKSNTERIIEKTNSSTYPEIDTQEKTDTDMKTYIGVLNEKIILTQFEKELFVTDMSGNIMHSISIGKDSIQNDFQITSNNIAVINRSAKNMFSFSILDFELNEVVKDINISEIKSNSHITFSGDVKKIAYVSTESDHEKVYISNVDLSDKTLVLETKNDTLKNVSFFSNIEFITADRIIFTGTGASSNQKQSNYVGYVDLQENNVFLLNKDYIGQIPIVQNGVAIWTQHLDYLDGRILVYKAGDFFEIKTNNIQEASRAILSSNGKHIVTAYQENDDLVFTLYDIDSMETKQVFKEYVGAENVSVSYLVNDYTSEIIVKIINDNTAKNVKINF